MYCIYVAVEAPQRRKGRTKVNLIQIKTVKHGLQYKT
jgi:hypothetical protein